MDLSGPSRHYQTIHGNLRGPPPPMPPPPPGNKGDGIEGVPLDSYENYML